MNCIRRPADTRAMTTAAATQAAAHLSLPPGRHFLGTAIPDAHQAMHWPWQPRWPAFPRPAHTPVSDPAQKGGRDHDR
jgi:hypothetical protein